MKSFTQAITLAAMYCALLAAFAQASQPLTSVQVREQLVQVEKIGYYPGASDSYSYPQNLKAAEARVADLNGTTQSSGYGSSPDGASQSGQPSKN